jgi:hypothetical protein
MKSEDWRRTWEGGGEEEEEREVVVGRRPGW